MHRKQNAKTATARSASNRGASYLRSGYVPIAAIVFAAFVSTGCTAGREFREAALPAFRSGSLSIVTGLLDGLFAAIEPEPQTTP